MKIVSEVYSEIGKAFANARLGLVLAAMITWMFSKETVSSWVLPIGLILGLAQVVFGGWLIQIAYYIKKKEDKNNG